MRDQTANRGAAELAGESSTGQPAARPPGEPAASGHHAAATVPPLSGASVATPGDQAVPPTVQSAAAWSWRLLAIAGALALLGWVLSFFKVLVVSVAVAALLAVLLAPVVRWLTRVGRVPHGLACAAAVLGLIGVVVGLVTVAGNSIIEGFGDLSTQALAGFDQLVAWISDGPLAVTAGQVDDYVDQLTDWAGANSGTLVSGALSLTTTVGHVAAGTLVALFCTLFFLLDGARIWAWLVGLLPRGVRTRVHEAGRRGLVTLGAYTRTQIVVAAADAVGIGLGAVILGLPLALPLAVLVFLASFVPFVGAIATGAIAVLVALVAQGPTDALLMLGIVVVVQQIESQVLQPMLMGQAVSLHPVAVLLAVAAGSIAAGIVGALFAVPVVAVLNTVILYLHGHDRFPEIGRTDRRGTGDGAVPTDRAPATA